MVFSPNGRLLATAETRTGTVALYAVRGSSLEEVGHSPNCNQPDALAFSPGGRVLAVANTEAGAVCILTVRGTRLGRKPVRYYTGPMITKPVDNKPTSVAFSPGGGLLAAANATAHSVALFTVHGSRLKKVPRSPFSIGSRSNPQTVAFSPRGGLLAVTGGTADDVSLAHASAAGLKQLAGSPFSTGSRSQPKGLAFSPGGGLLSTTDPGTDTVSVWALSSP